MTLFANEYFPTVTLPRIHKFTVDHWQVVTICVCCPSYQKETRVFAYEYITICFLWNIIFKAN